MINEIGAYLETNLAADLGPDHYAGDLPLREIVQGADVQVTTYPAIKLVEGTVRPTRVEFGTADPTQGVDRVHEWILHGSVLGATRNEARANAETLAMRCEAWILTNYGLGGLTDGAQTCDRTEPGPWAVSAQGSRNLWMGMWRIPIYIHTVT
jgi:hypothetical protein